jgi:NADPH:quinone reductase-like Zn-dependent oxidoreductase
MKAVHHSSYGAFDQLKICEIPTPGKGDVIVRMKAAGLNVADCFAVTGKPFPARLAFGLTKPSLGIPGMDGAGVVESVGPGVTEFKPGDEVFGSGTGTCAEYASFKKHHLVMKPTELDFTEAAAIPIAGLAALHAVRDCMRIKQGHKLLINGASGGVGSFAVQLAVLMGAEVTAVCSAQNVDLVRSLGAHHVLDYTKQDFTDSRNRWDFILDNVENHDINRCRRVLTERGMLVLNSGTGSDGLGFFIRLVKPVLLNGFTRHKLRRHVSGVKAADLNELGRLAAQKKIRVVLEKAWPLEQTAAALTHISKGHTRGRIVIKI